MTTTSAPTLDANWSPNAGGCLQTTNFWIWDYGDPRDKRTVLRGPSQTTDCFESSWGPRRTFEGTACPSLYTSACSNATDGAVTCCPEAAAFSCQTEFPTGVHAEAFRCVSQWGNNDNIFVTVTNLVSGGEPKTQSRTRGSNEHLFGLALMYTTPTATSSGSTLPSSTSSTTLSISSPSPTTSTMASSHLSPGAYAGIGVGAAVAVFLIAILLWLLYRRRRRAANRPTELSTTPMSPGAIGTPMTYATPDSFAGAASHHQHPGHFREMSQSQMSQSQISSESRSPNPFIGNNMGPKDMPIGAGTPMSPKEMPANSAPLYELENNQTAHSPWSGPR